MTAITPSASPRSKSHEDFRVADWVAVGMSAILSDIVRFHPTAVMRGQRAWRRETVSP